MTHSWIPLLSTDLRSIFHQQRPSQHWEPIGKVPPLYTIHNYWPTTDQWGNLGLPDNPQGFWSEKISYQLIIYQMQSSMTSQLMLQGRCPVIQAEFELFNWFYSAKQLLGFVDALPRNWMYGFLIGIDHLKGSEPWALREDISSSLCICFYLLYCLVSKGHTIV